MEKAQEHRYEQFVAVIWGAENPEKLAPLTEKYPSILLPLGSRCILSYQLDFLAQNHIRRIIYKNKLTKYVEKQSIEGMRIDPLPMEDEFSVDDVLAALYDKIDKDFIIMEGQVVTSMDLTHLLELHIRRRSTLSLQLYRKPKALAAAPQKKGKGGEDKKRKENYTVYGTFREQELTPDSQEARLVFVAESTDLESGCVLTKGLLQSTEKITLTADYNLIKLCVCSPMLLQYSFNKKHAFLSFFNDLVPHFIQKQFSKSLQRTFNSFEPHRKDIEKKIKAITESNGESTYDPVQVWTILSSQFTSPYLNISSKDSYLFANSEVMKMQEKTLFAQTEENWPHLLQKYTTEAEAIAKGGKKAVLPPETPAFVKQVTEGSVVSEDVKIQDEVMIKKTLVCPHCTIGKGSKLVNSIIQKGAAIGKGCTLTSCVVGAKAKIADKTNLKDVIIANEQDVNEETMDEPTGGA